MVEFMLKRARSLTPVLVALDPKGLYSSGTIAGFVKATGLLQLMYPEGTIEKLAHTRTRVALCARRRLLCFSSMGDARLRYGRFQAWYGWRWLGFDNIKEALAWRNMHELSLYQVTIDESLNLKERHILWQSLDIWSTPEGYLMQEGGVARWHEIRAILMKLWLVGHAAERGLDQNTRYTYEEWYAEPPEILQAGVFRAVFLNLDKTKYYSVEDLAGEARQILPSIDEKVIRASLFHLARANFPCSDQTDSELRPNWEGWRWYQATFNSLDQSSPHRISVGRGGHECF